MATLFRRALMVSLAVLALAGCGTPEALLHPVAAPSMAPLGATPLPAVAVSRGAAVAPSAVGAPSTAP